MTLMEMLNGHYKLWMEISRIMTPELKEKCAVFCSGVIKEIAIKNIGETEYINSNCYCCEYSDFCSECPIKWMNGNCMNSEYKDFCSFVKLEDYETARELAARIANLPCKGTREIVFGIECFNRNLILVVEEEKYEIALKIIEDAYIEWNQGDDDVWFICCEEHILNRLSENGIEYVDKSPEMEDD